MCAARKGCGLLMGVIMVGFSFAVAENQVIHEMASSLDFDTPNKTIITVVGTGYVGLVTGAGLAEFGNTVICADINREKIEALHNGIMPIYEPGLDVVVARNVGLRRLSFTYDVDDALQKADIIFIAVGTPMDEDGTADLRAVLSVAKAIARNNQKYQVIVTKSTVPVGTGAKIKSLLNEHGLTNDRFDMVSNPEFLREGSAVEDFLVPDRIVIGSESSEAMAIVCSAYKSLIKNNVPCVLTNLASSEMIKYASNAFLATKISFINEVANLCDKTGANVKTVAYAMGLDHRISPQFLNPGPGFGGSCFPKDTQALLLIGKQNDVCLFSLHAALQSNAQQHLVPIYKLLRLLGIEESEYCLRGKKIAVLGAAFKANTDDIRYSPASVAMNYLLQLGAEVTCFDPVAMSNAALELPEVIFCEDAYEAVNGTDAIIIMTEWNEFKQLDWESVAVLVKEKILVDARNIIDIEVMHQLGFRCDMIGLSYLCRPIIKKNNLPYYAIVTI